MTRVGFAGARGGSPGFGEHWVELLLRVTPRTDHGFVDISRWDQVCFGNLLIASLLYKYEKLAARPRGEKRSMD